MFGAQHNAKVVDLCVLSKSELFSTSIVFFFELTSDGFTACYLLLVLN